MNTRRALVDPEDTAARAAAARAAARGERSAAAVEVALQNAAAARQERRFAGEEETADDPILPCCMSLQAAGLWAQLHSAHRMCLSHCRALEAQA